jgi:hypothetical protein
MAIEGCDPTIENLVKIREVLTGGTAIITPQWGPAGTTLGVSLQPQRAGAGQILSMAVIEGKHGRNQSVSQ